MTETPFCIGEIKPSIKGLGQGEIMRVEQRAKQLGLIMSISKDKIMYRYPEQNPVLIVEKNCVNIMARGLGQQQFRELYDLGQETKKLLK